jgi:hypothetical protein
MLEGTKRLMPSVYEKFKASMLSAADDGELPVTLQLRDIRDFTLKDVQDLFVEFSLETGLEMNGFLSLEDGTGMLLLQVQVDRPENPGNTYLQ